MTRPLRTPLAALGLLLALGLTLPALAGRAAQAQERPNFVFILIDDLRWDALGCTGHPFAKTPHIDRIAKEGALFRNAYVTTPLCSPSRASFLTGRYAHANGVRGNGPAYNGRSHELVSFHLLLQRAGYASAFVGKIHMGNDDRPRPGMDRWVSFKGQGSYENPQINIDGQSQRVEGYMTDILSAHAAEFIRRPHARPFVLTLSHKAIHGPFTPAERHKNLYSDDPIRRAPSHQDTLEGKPVLRRQVGNLRPVGPGTGSGDGLIRNQLRAMNSVDEGVGQVLRALEETGRLANTVVIFTSDNGYFWGEHGLGDKRAAYEESIRIPLLVRYPPLLKPGTVIEQPALNVDIAPTLLELGGAAIPGEVQGRSLVPLFRGNAAGWRRAFLTEYFAEQQFPRIPTWQAVSTDRWKYIHYTELEGMDELYDLRADPHELKNRIADPDARPALQELKAELARLLRNPS